jgi:hypothetical protein
MKFEPQKFFIGLMDFFSILRLGVLLTCLLMGELGPVVLRNRYFKLAGGKPGPPSCSRAISSAPGTFCWAKVREKRMNSPPDHWAHAVMIAPRWAGIANDERTCNK